ncbi:hydrogen peroxide-inducible genes activator [Hoeflea sp.]|uniref:hydrogen peroxide-inducible genes activator n=1 Tax=Hoeflea sp. TaxID=1940281 RepID=UPI003B019717
MTTLRQLHYLVALSEELHFRRAAERVNVTQPTLSAQIQELEKKLRAPLVERGAARVALTPLGREIAERARRVLSDVRDIEDLAASSQHGFDGTIRLGVPPTLGPYLLPHIVPDLHGKYPGLRLYVREGKPVELQGQLQAGGFDLVISPMPIAHGDLEVERLFREPLKVVAAPDHPLASRQQILSSDLAGQSVLAIERGHHLHEQVSRLCEDFDATLLRDYEGTSLDTLRLMAGMGVGLAFLPALYVRSEIDGRSEIAILNLNMPNLFRQMGLAWRKRSVHASLFKEIADLIRTTAERKLPDVTVTR